jgi:alpha-L-rhamnosidase
MMWPTQWVGRWIWAAPAPAPALSFAGSPAPDRSLWNRFVHLRRLVVLEHVPAAVPARVTADSRYVLWVNGVEVSRGPVRNVPERLAFHELDLAPHLHAGPNVIAALVRYYGGPSRWWRPAAQVGQLGVGSFLFEAPAIGVQSDATWRGVPGPWEQHPAGHDIGREMLDGRSLPRGWLDADHDDRAWPEAVELHGPGFAGMSAIPPCIPFGGLEPSGVAELTATRLAAAPVASGFVVPGASDDLVSAYAEARVVDDAGDAADAARFVTFDVGQLTHGTVALDLDAAAGVAVDVYVGEDIAADGRAVVAPRHWAAGYVAAGGHDEHVETFDPVGFRYITTVTRGEGRVTGAAAVERRYPTSGAASFTCDDDRLEQVWRTGKRTVELCALDAFVDCPGREQQAWVGDSYLHVVVTMLTSADWRLVRRNLRIGAHSRRADGLLSAISAAAGSQGSFNIPEYSLHWVRALSRYVERSGDRATARELLPAATEVLDACERHRDADGFLRRLPGVVFVDWAQTERGDVTGAVDALYAAALLDHARLLELVLGDLDGGAIARARHAVTASAFEALWDEHRGVYVDALHDGRGPGRRVSQQTNALVIVGHCAPEGRWPRMLDAVLDASRVKMTLCNGDLPEHQHWSYQRWEPEGFDVDADVVMAQPFMAHFLHQAVAAAGRRDLIPDLCLRWWPQVERGNTTFEEFWQAPPGTTSRCHGWSASPTFDLTTHVLGVRQIIESADDLGFRRAVVAPSFAGMGRVGGVVPTPHGDLVVDLVAGGTGALSIPAGMTEVVVEIEGRPARHLGPGRHVLD